jgi:hypothetical protein
MQPHYLGASMGFKKKQMDVTNMGGCEPNMWCKSPKQAAQAQHQASHMPPGQASG